MLPGLHCTKSKTTDACGWAMVCGPGHGNQNRVSRLIDASQHFVYVRLHIVSSTTRPSDSQRVLNCRLNTQYRSLNMVERCSDRAQGGSNVKAALAVAGVFGLAGLWWMRVKRRQSKTVPDAVYRSRKVRVSLLSSCPSCEPS